MPRRKFCVLAVASLFGTLTLAGCPDVRVNVREQNERLHRRGGEVDRGEGDGGGM